MDGILLLNKPRGLTSHDCVNITRRAFNTRKVGHSGTLDPEASGVLVLAINKATRILEFLNQDDKIYEFEVCFNVLTNTLDHTGEVTKEQLHQSMDIKTLDEVVNQFKGEYAQTPPAYAAVKVGGKKLYEYAREGLTIPEVPSRNLKVYDILRLSEPFYKEGMIFVKFKVHASKGLYVRKLAEDIAEKLGTVAHTTMIHRVKAGKFTLGKSISLDALKEGNVSLMSMSEALNHIPSYRVDDSLYTLISHGKKLTIESDAPLLRLIDESDALIALYEKMETTIYKPKKVFITGG